MSVKVRRETPQWQAAQAQPQPGYCQVPLVYQGRSCTHGIDTWLCMALQHGSTHSTFSGTQTSCSGTPCCGCILVQPGMKDRSITTSKCTMRLTSPSKLERFEIFGRKANESRWSMSLIAFCRSSAWSLQRQVIRWGARQVVCSGMCCDGHCVQAVIAVAAVAEYSSRKALAVELQALGLATVAPFEGTGSVSRFHLRAVVVRARQSDQLHSLLLRHFD